MAEFRWDHLMRLWNASLIEDAILQADIPTEVRATGWLGFPGAEAPDLTALETRLGMHLSPSYRAFLAYSNGWRTLTRFIPAVWSTSAVEWFTVRNQATIDAWLSAGTWDVSDTAYYAYGEDGCAEGLIRPAYLQTALEISDCEPAGTAVPKGLLPAWHA